MANDKHHTIHNIQRALDTYRTRNRVYGNNYKRFGEIMMALYPNGVCLNTVHQWNRFGIILQKISKLSRYVTDPMRGHMDSIHDDAVYSFMLEELDAEAAGLDVTPPEPLVTVQDRPIGFKVFDMESRLVGVIPDPCEHIYRYPCHFENMIRCEDIALNTEHNCGSKYCINCGAKQEQEDGA